MENSPALYSGYDVRNIAFLDQRYKCPVCKCILKDAVQLACGDRICKLCFSHEDGVVQCPKCMKTTPTSQIRFDKAFNKEIQTLHVDCIYCEWSGDLKIYQNHLQQSHNQYKCSNCNQTFNSLTLLNQHTKRTCSEILVNCELQQYGCNGQILRRNLSEHYLSEVHQRVLLLFILQSIAMKTEQNTELVKFSTHLEQQKLDPAFNIATTTTTTATTATTTITNLVTDEYKIHEGCIKETIDTLTGGIEALNDELQQLSDESLQKSQLIESIDQNIAMLKISCEESNAALNALNTNMIILQQDCSSLKQKVEETKFTSYDGTLIWKITNVQEKMMDAQSERQVSIYSPPFFSSPTGYKMRGRLYLFGDGNARRTHMSLFFVLMRSLNDSLLQFPFSYKVTFCLFDQSGQQQNIIDSFRPDTRSNSFQKPQCEMNIASGIPKFVKLSIIQQTNNPYIKDDTMFIKIMVDFQSLPKTILPYVLSLNPGIPIHCQQQMIQQEMERRAQLQLQQVSRTNSTNNKGATSDTSSINNQQQFDGGGTTNK